MRRERLWTLVEGLGDERGRRVALVSHCLLNENVRYLGGAFRAAAVDEVVDAFRARGCGLHQMPCPERVAWGGALKRRILPFYGSRGSALYRLRRPLLAMFALYTRRRYAHLARAVVRDIEDYLRSGVEVVGVVGIRGSPSCAVTATCTLPRCLDAISRCDVAHPDRAALNDAVLGGELSHAEGLFVSALRRRLARRRLCVPFLEHDLVTEMRTEQRRESAHAPWTSIAIAEPQVTASTATPRPRRADRGRRRSQSC